MLDLNMIHKGDMVVFPVWLKVAQEEAFHIKAVSQLAAASMPSPKEIYL